MSPEFQTFVPDPDILLELEPQELASLVLNFLKAQGGTLRIDRRTSSTLLLLVILKLSRATHLKKGLEF